MLVSAAEVIDERNAGTPGRRRGGARAFMRTVLIGPVATADRTLSVLVPVEAPDADGLIPRPEGPFARQVTSGLEQAVRAAHDAAGLAGAAEDGPDAFRLSAGLGVTAALCKALAAIPGDASSPFEMAFTWSPDRPRDPSEPIRFTPDLFDPLRRGARELDRPEVIPDVVLRGRVTDLRLAPETAHGTVGVRGHFASDPFRRAHQADVRLPLPAYHRALRAHSDARPVEVRGTLELRRSRWLLHSTGLTVVDGA
jgi:hypothetical protein